MWVGGQTGTGGVGEEEDYGIEEGVSYFPSSSGYVAEH